MTAGFLGPGIAFRPAPLSAARSIGVISEKVKTFTCAGLPGTGRGDDAVAAGGEVDKARGDAHARAIVGVGAEVEKSAGAVPGEAGNCVPIHPDLVGMPGPEPTMMLSAVVPSICEAVTLMPPRASHQTPRTARARSRSAACRRRLARIGDDFGRVVLAGADDEIVDAVVVDIAHGDAGVPSKPGKGVTVAIEPVAIAVVDFDFG